jgi:hypothetical protein
MTTTTPLPCPHCQQTLTGNYCAHCGEHRPQVLRPAQLLGPSLEQLGQLDGPVGRTLLSLLREPATLIAAYWRGDRRYHSHPIKLVFWATTIFVAVLTFTGLLDKVTLVDAAAKQWISLVLALNSYLVFVYLLPSAWLASRRFTETRNITESYVALLFITALSLWIKLLSVPFAFLYPDVVFWFHRFLPPALFAWVLYPLLRGHPILRVIWGVLIYTLYFLTAIAGNSAIIALANLITGNNPD